MSSGAKMYISNNICRSAARIAASHTGKFCSASRRSSTAFPSLAGAPEARSSARSPTCASASEGDTAGGCSGTFRLSHPHFAGGPNRSLIRARMSAGGRSQAKVPMVVMAAATSAITEQSPFITRTGFTLPQVTQPMAEWAAKNGIKKVVTLVTDYGPGIDAESTFKKVFTASGGEVLESLRVPLRNPDFAPFLQKVHDLAPNAVFVFVPSGVGSIFMKQFTERGLDKSGIRLIGTGDVTDDDILNDMGDVALGVVTTFHYSAAHPSAANK